MFYKSMKSTTLPLISLFFLSLAVLAGDRGLSRKTISRSSQAKDLELELQDSELELPDPKNYQEGKAAGKKKDPLALPTNSFYPPHLSSNKIGSHGPKMPFDLPAFPQKKRPHVTLEIKQPLSSKTGPKVASTQEDLSDDFLKAFQSMFTSGGLRAFKNPFALSSSSNDKNAKENHTEIVLGEHYKIQTQAMNFTVPEDLKGDEFYVVQIYGIGTAVIDFYDSAASPQKRNESKSVSFETLSSASFIPINPKILGKKGQIMTLSNIALLFVSDWSFEVTKKTHFELQVESNVKIFGGFMDKVNILMTKNTTKNATNATNGTENGTNTTGNGTNTTGNETETPPNTTVPVDKRMQFIVSTSLDRQEVTGEEELKMLVNFAQKRFPTENNFDFKPSGSLGTGLVKTLAKGNPYYCEEAVCQYRVTIWGKGVDEVIFYVSELENGATLAFHRSLILTEEVEPGEHLFYRLEVPQNEDNLIFRLDPIEGVTSLFVNPDFRPDEIKKYKYAAISSRPEELIITNFEKNEFNFTGRVFYVAFESASKNESTTFKFKASKISPDEKFFIQENSAQSGVVAIGEIINYVVDFHNFSEETEEALDVKVNFDTYFGNADVYVKECPVSEPECRVTKKDIEEYRKLAGAGDHIFKYLRYDDGQSLMKKSHDGQEDHRSGNLHLRFNCLPYFRQMREKIFGLPKNEGDNKNQLHGGMRSSASCQFAIGVSCRDSPNLFGAYYKLIVSGDNVHKQLVIEEPVSLKIPPNFVDSFKLTISPFDLMRFDGVRFKFMTIEGDYTVAFSPEVKYPNQTNAVATLNINDEHYATLKTIRNITELNFTTLFHLDPDGNAKPRPKRPSLEPQKKFIVNAEGKIEKIKPVAPHDPNSDKNNPRKFFTQKIGNDLRHIYLTIASRKHSVIELYLEPIKKSQSAMLVDPEIVPPGLLINRSIDFLYQFFTIEDKKQVYYSNFVYRDAFQTTKSTKNFQMKITLNTKISGVKLCVQVGKLVYIVEEPCTFSSETGTLIIRSAQYDFVNDPKMVISVQKQLTFEEAMDTMPIDFSLLVSVSGNDFATELNVNGKPFTSVIDSFQSMMFKVDLQKAVKSALFLFESESISTKAEFGLTTNDNFVSLEVFDHKNYGIEIKDVKSFCRNYAPSAPCVVDILVYSHAKTRSRFSLTYTMDGRPFALKDGDFLSIPGGSSQYFLFEVSNKDPLSFSVYSPDAKGVLYSVGVSHPNLIKKQLSSINFSYKTDIQNFVQITYSSDDLAKLETDLIGYLYEPKFVQKGAVVDHKKEFSVLKGPERCKVVAKTQAADLVPFYDLPESCPKGEFRYYHVTSEEDKQFSVLLSAITGHVTLFVKKGRSKLPSLTDYDSKQSCKIGREVQINDEILKSPAGHSQSYTLGVFCDSHAKFSLIYLPSFPGLIRLQYQRLLDIQLTKGKEYFFDFFNQLDKYHTLLFSQDSDVRVSALDFRVSKKKNLLEMISEPKNWEEEFVFKKGSNPRKHFSEGSVEKDNHVVVKMEALDRDSQVNFLIYDPLQPIVISAEKRVHFGMGEGDKVVFLCHLNADYEDVDFTLKLDHGDVDVWISESLAALDDPTSPDLTHYRINSYDQVSHVFRPVPKPSETNDIILFNDVYIRIAAKRLSNFWMSLHPKDIMKEARANEPELIRASETDDVYVYFSLEPALVKDTKSLEIQIVTVKSFEQKPVFLFNSNELITLDAEKVFPMFIHEIQEWADHEFVHTTVRPAIENGSYILKILPHPARVPFKVTFVVNNEKTLTPNGFSKNYLGLTPDSQEHRYSVFLPHKGEFRVVLETCEPIDVREAVFYPTKSSKKAHQLELPKHLVQGFPYLAIKNQPGQPALRELREFDYPVYRMSIESPGLVNFKVRSRKELVVGAQDMVNATAGLADYFLMTEFIPKNKELVLKDFVNVINPTSELDKYVTGQRYINSGSDLEISTKFPSFKPQLEKDYPHIKKIQITLFFTLFASDAVEEILKRCGISSLFLLDNVSKNITKTFNINEIDTERMPSYVTVLFDKYEDKALDGTGKKRVLFSHAKIRFIEDENDEFDLTLEEKVTLVPYFVMDVNPRPFMTTSMIYYIVAGVLCGLFVAGICLFKCIGDEEAEPRAQARSGYEAPKNGGWSTDRKLEMSSISSVPDRPN